MELKVGRSIGAEHYQNPMVILAAIAVFMIFHNLKLESQVINRMSKGCFTVFLVHWFVCSNSSRFKSESDEYAESDADFDLQYSDSVYN